MSKGESNFIYTYKKDSVKLKAVQLEREISFPYPLLIFSDSTFSVM